MTYVLIWDPVERLLWSLIIFLYIEAALLYYFRGKQEEDDYNKQVLIAMAFIIILVPLERIFFYMSDLQIMGYFSNGAFYGDFNNVTPYFEISDKCGYIATKLGILCAVLILKNLFGRIRYVFGIIFLILILLIMILPYDLAREANQYGMVLTYLIMAIMLKSAITRSSPEVRPISLFLLAGSYTTLLSSAFYTNPIKMVNIFPLFLAPSICLLGAIIFMAPMVIDSKHYKNPKIFVFILVFPLLIFILATVLIFLLIFLIGLTIGVFFNILILIFYFSLYIYTFITLIRQKRTKEGGLSDVLGILPRKKRVTEEEVSVSKEKKICLVCKGKVARFDIYICPECDSLYHRKCAKVLVGQENTCWACDSVLDESKPVKAKAAEKEELLIEQEAHKGEKK